MQPPIARVRTAAELLARHFGADNVTIVGPRPVTVGTTAARLLSNNPSRVGFLIVSLGEEEVHLLPQAGVSSSAGITLAGDGASLEVTTPEDWTLPSLEWFAVASLVAVTVLITEAVLL